jgi:tRNA/tmRNA/rRNA uracil-C5-methylase (TrmA/RlmC/RlmD family)
MPASCPHRPPCSACPRFGAPDLDPAARATLDALARTHGLPAVPQVSGALAGFRLRARLAIRGRVDSPRVGLFQEGTHRVVSVPHCCVHHPLINRVADTVRQVLAEAQVPAYSEKAHRGLARYLQVVVERCSQTAQIVLVGNSPSAAPLATALDIIRQRLGGELHSLWFNAQCDRSNVILGPAFEHWCGPQSVVEHFGGPAVHYPPGAFGQNNLDIAERIIGAVRAQIPAGARVVEFYAGVGAIGLSVLELAGSLHVNELSPQSLLGLELGLAALDARERAKVKVSAGSAEECRAAAAEADVVIVDPPRKGLEAGLTRQLREHPPGQQLLYVSCALPSLLRDTAQLVAEGRLRLAGLTAFNLLPFTGHVETLARFERARAGAGG